MKTGTLPRGSVPVFSSPDVSAVAVEAVLGVAELEGQREGRDAGQEQRDADPDDDGRRAMTSGWNRIHSEQSSSSTPVKMVQPEPAISRALMSPPSPMALKPRIISQNPRKMGSVAAESPTLKIRMMPRMISMIPPAIIQPRPVMKCLLAEESTTSRMPEISISHPKTSDMPR